MADPSLIPNSSQQYINRPRESVGILMVAGILIFILSISALAGLIFYKQDLSKQKDSLIGEIKKQEKEFNQTSIQDWARTAEAIDLAKQILQEHSYVSNAFAFVQKNTLPDVRYSKFEFDADSKKISLGAEAKGYAAMAQQRQIFINNPAISSATVGDFNLDKTGKVLFSVDLIFNSSLLTSQ
ncbi:hypothetical protein A3H04_00675 [Candidatus Giovannonibacteria bacterium RIFCSPLOWO2_12_FULL_43_11c]|uniref:PilN domain-containing protein n=1 Tax=Candidatus Giovannonibacteria bacterium RIFCSPHIGHO2_12_FULL_43_15 TaxID=1798341 RepID=A0A1F5WQ87_9BACT|nr:MAG: hypothetical protein A2739_01350 [Candidatus Giovannonibacteria bacterium RIFCSPHIGHO2_01_FULL_43_100]OGF67748.1 MAG: hypothetical protein A3B97_01565 [Candidatus Giovannonibacteria bacterium RIFCSPHIGHO2_02_FULL_43_32]OGF77421.1 MAG: hypothetical protein A3F23_01615 [Candidatus Giovannonibacteria bacterium RIFCSPHIGHO2_12_FULL_43_15]OGF79038.1 MAG: hypothetical protein A3A15_03245 [Candidatus Giovannonibacteria bacterium RIFCSPLOWO2_01_FULL_43_60]OGF92131.1 MAG: hypothetical protein A3